MDNIASTTCSFISSYTWDTNEVNSELKKGKEENENNTKKSYGVTFQTT